MDVVLAERDNTDSKALAFIYEGRYKLTLARDSHKEARANTEVITKELL